MLDDNTAEMRTYLIQRGAIPEIGDFIEAVHARDAANVRKLLAMSPALRMQIDWPLFSFGAQAVVVAKNDRPVVEALLEFGANINVKTDWWAGGFGVLDDTDPEQAAWLIERGAIVDIHAAAGLAKADTVREWIARDPSLVHAPGGDGKRPLHWASTKEIIDILLAHGAEIDARCLDHQSTAAQYRVRDIELCRYFISRGAQVDIFMAAALGDEALVNRVLDADPGCITARIGRPGYTRCLRATSISGSSRRPRSCWLRQSTADRKSTICSLREVLSRSSFLPRASLPMKGARRASWPKTRTC